MKIRRIVALGIIILAASIAAIAQDRLSQDARIKAEQVLNRYVELEHAFDPAIADLYADDAVIQTRRTYPNGEVRNLSIPAAEYKALIRKTTPLAKARNDVSRYSNCTYRAAVMGRVRVACARYSELKNYTSPMSLVVGPGPRGDWLVFEELSESQP